MTTTPSSDNTVLVLYPPRLPSATELIAGLRYGVPKHSYDLEPMGARVDVLPYEDQAPGDTVRLDLNGQPGIDSKPTQSESDTVTLYIPKKLLLPDFVNRLTYTIIRGSQNRGTSEPPLELIYNLIRPGNQDRDPGVDGHSELQLLLPDAIKNGVGSDFPVAGVQVCVSYPYCRAYDVIRLNLNGHDVFHTVTPLQAPLPGSDTPVRVCFTVTRADLAAGGDHAQYRISYTVTDQPGNGPDPDSPWSATQVVDVDLAGNRLPPPLLRERMNDPGDDPTLIDLEKLGSNPLLVIAVPSAPRFQKGDQVNATYVAKLSGQPDVRVEVSGVIEQDEFGIFQPCVMQVANDKVIARSRVEVSFDLVNGGVVVGKSRIAMATVVGESAIDLKPPFLVAPATSPIDVLAYPDGVTVQVEHLPALTGDTAQLMEVNPPPGAVTFPKVPLNANKRANFTLSPEFLVQRHGNALSLFWIWSRGGVEMGCSVLLPLQVMNISDEDKRLPTPEVPETKGTAILDITTFTGDATVTVAPWQPWIVQGQKVSLVCYGVQENGNEFNISLLQNYSLSDTEVTTGLNRPIPRAALQQLKNNSALRIELHAELKNNVITVKFPQLLIAIQTVALFEDFETIPIGQFIPNLPVETPSLIITSTVGFTNSAIVDSVTDLPIIPGQMHGHMLLHGMNTAMTLKLKGIYSRVDFFAWSYYDGSSVTNMSSYDINNRHLENIVVRQKLVKKYSFTIPGIARIEINNPWSSSNITVFDHFTFTP